MHILRNKWQSRDQVYCMILFSLKILPSSCPVNKSQGGRSEERLKRHLTTQVKQMLIHTVWEGGVGGVEVSGATEPLRAVQDNVGPCKGTSVHP